MTEGVRPVLFEEFERRYVRPKPGRALVVGSRVYKTRKDRRKLYADAIGVDMAAGEGVDRVEDLCNRGAGFDYGRFAHVDCISVMEHCTKPADLAANIEEYLLEPSGTLLVSAPFIWRVHSYPDDYWRFTVAALRELFPRINWVKLCYADREFHDDVRVPQIIHDGHIYFARTEVYGFGSLKG